MGVFWVRDRFSGGQRVWRPPDDWRFLPPRAATNIASHYRLDCAGESDHADDCGPAIQAVYFLVVMSRLKPATRCAAIGDMPSASSAAAHFLCAWMDSTAPCRHFSSATI